MASEINSIRKLIREVLEDYHNHPDIVAISKSKNGISLSSGEVTSIKCDKSKSNKCETNVFHYIHNRPNENLYPVKGYAFENDFPIEHWWVYDADKKEYFDPTPGSSSFGRYVGIVGVDTKDEIHKTKAPWHEPERGLNPFDVDFFRSGNIKSYLQENTTQNIYYHGVGPKGKFASFDKSQIGSTSGNDGHFGKGFYFTDTESKARSFSEFFGGTGEVLSVRLDMKNPFYVNESSLVRIGEKYKLNLPKKTVVAIDLKDLLLQLKTKDIVAFNLLASITKNKDHSRGWEEFKTKHPDTYEGETGLDLNIVSDWYEETQGTRYGRGVNDFSVEELREIGIEPKLIYDFEEDVRMDYLTDLGQNSDDWTNAIKQEGHDSIIAGDEIVVFESEQIKIIEAESLSEQTGSDEAIQMYTDVVDLNPKAEKNQKYIDLLKTKYNYKYIPPEKRYKEENNIIDKYNGIGYIATTIKGTPIAISIFKTPGLHRSLTIKASTENLTPVGRVGFNIDSKSNTLRIGGAEVNQKYRRQGIYTLLIKVVQKISSDNGFQISKEGRSDDAKAFWSSIDENVSSKSLSNYRGENIRIEELIESIEASLGITLKKTRRTNDGWISEGQGFMCKVTMSKIEAETSNYFHQNPLPFVAKIMAVYKINNPQGNGLYLRDYPIDIGNFYVVITQKLNTGKIDKKDFYELKNKCDEIGLTDTHYKNTGYDSEGNLLVFDLKSDTTLSPLTKSLTFNKR